MHRLAPGTSPVELLHRLVPDAAFSTPDLIRSVLLSTKKLPSTPVSPTSEVACASLISALIDLFSRHGDLVGIDPVVFVAVIEHFIPPESPLSSIILHSFDAPPDDPQAILPPLPETTGLRALARILSSSTAAAQVLWADWVSSARQLSLLERLLCQPIEVFPLGGLPDLPKVVTPEDVAIASPIVRSQAQALYPCAWNCRELVNLLMRMLGSAQSKQAAEDEDMAITAMVGDVLERAMKEAPELFVIGLAQMEPSLYRDNLLSRLAPGFLSGQSGYQLVFHRLLQIDSERVTSMLAQHYAEDQMNVARIVDIALELDVMPRLLEAHSWGFVLDVASLAARRDILQLPLYLRSTVSQYGSTFVKEALAFVGYKVSSLLFPFGLKLNHSCSNQIRSDLERHQNDHPSEPHTMPLTPEVFADFLKALRQNHELFAPGDVDMFKEIRSSGLQLFPSLLTFGPQTEAEQSMVPATFSPDLEAEVDSLFRKMYNDEASAQELVTTLQRARDSGNPVQLEFFECTLHVLMDELRFVGAYPVKERDLTAQLFGRLILHQVIDGIPLGIAVRIVRDNLQKSPDTPSYHFGIMALNQFLDRLQDWPQLLRNILDIPHLPEASPETHARLLRIGHETNDGSNGLETSLAGPAFTALQAGEPDMALEEPGGKSADMVKFEINNLTAKELPGRVREAARHLEEKHCRWLAHHMINSRVCVEPNNHGLYLEFIDKLGFARLHKQILYETLHKSASLLNLESTLSSSAERGLLKNLGVWLGLITLARNRPIKYDHVAFKELLIEGFDSGRLIVAIPFVCKVLEQCSKSKVFKPPNPWLMAIIRLLVELYQFAELKLNLKFEIEVLCKALGIDLKEVEPTSILRQRPSPDEQMESAADGVVSRQNASKPSSLTTVADQTSESLHQVIDLALEKLPALLVFSNNVPFVTANPSIKRVVHVAIDKAIRDIIVPVVERSVTIAGITSKELVLKDFAAEGDEDKLARSAELTVQNLAGSLALVTCKEPLRLSIIQHLKTGFVQSGFAEVCSVGYFECEGALS